jgi:hypothetical protein
LDDPLCPLVKKMSPTVTAAVAGADVGGGVLGGGVLGGGVLGGGVLGGGVLGGGVLGGGVLGGGVLGELGDVGVEALSSPQPTTRLVASIPPSSSSIV